MLTGFARSRLASWLLPALLASTCGRGPDDQRRPSSEPQILPDDSVVILTGASKVQRSREFGGGVRYELQDAFPADAAIAMLDKRLAGVGWKPSDVDIFNPKRESSLREWGVVEVDGKLSFTWIGHWQDQKANALRISLLYPASRANGRIIPGSPGTAEITAFTESMVEALPKVMK